MYAVRLNKKWKLSYFKPLVSDECILVTSREQYEMVVLEDAVCQAAGARPGFELSEMQQKIMSARIRRMTEDFKKTKKLGGRPYTLKEQEQLCKIIKDLTKNVPDII